MRGGSDPSEEAKGLGEDLRTRTKMLTVKSVTDWNWVSSDDHRGRVPAMPEIERREWVRLAEKNKRTADEQRLFGALDRKLRYRAERDLDPVGV